MLYGSGVRKCHIIDDVTLDGLRCPLCPLLYLGSGPHRCSLCQKVPLIVNLIQDILLVLHLFVSNSYTYHMVTSLSFTLQHFRSLLVRGTSTTLVATTDLLSYTRCTDLYIHLTSCPIYPDPWSFTSQRSVPLLVCLRKFHESCRLTRRTLEIIDGSKSGGISDQIRQVFKCLVHREKRSTGKGL